MNLTTFAKESNFLDFLRLSYETVVNIILERQVSATSSDLSDEELVDLYMASQKSIYFDTLYKRYSRMVFGKCLSILKSTEAANDATQEIFIKVLTKLSRFKKKSRFSTWLYSISYNYCIDLVRKKKKEYQLFTSESEEMHNVPEEVNDSEILEVSISRLKVVLNKIPIGDKAVLMMKYQDGMSIRDISGVMLKTESAIKMKLKRAKQKFVKVYSENYKD